MLSTMPLKAIIAVKPLEMAPVKEKMKPRMNAHFMELPEDYKRS